MTPLSRGARLCEAIIRAARAERGGLRRCGRPYLARRLACSQRTVSRYVAELRAAGRLEVTPPRQRRTRGGGWCTVGVNTYRLRCTPHPAPHVQRRRSHRGDTHVTPSPNGDQGGRAQRTPPPDPGQLINPADAIRAQLARIAHERTRP